MTNPLPIPDDLRDKVSLNAQVAIPAMFVTMWQRHAGLEALVRGPEALLKFASTNSPDPPSLDPVRGALRCRRRGRRMTRRVLVPMETLREIWHYEPGYRRRSGQHLGGDDPNPLVHLVARLPWIEPGVDEYRLPRLTFPRCGEMTCGDSPRVVPSRSFAPALQATMSRFAGAYHSSKRRIHQAYSDVFAVSVFTGMISKPERQTTASLQVPDIELGFAVHRAKSMNIDKISWREQRRKVRFWKTATDLAQVFTIVRNRGGRIARVVLDNQAGQAVDNGRCEVSDWIMTSQRQVRRGPSSSRVQVRIDRGGDGEPIGGRLFRLSS